jgi:hypothetical protein
MTTDQKKAFLLLKSVILHHQGTEEGESHLLADTASAMGATEELEWAKQFIIQDRLTAFERARDYLNKLTVNWDNPQKLEHLIRVWESIHQKGYITEMEATAILKLAKDWKVQQELMAFIRKKRNPV